MVGMKTDPPKFMNFQSHGPAVRKYLEWLVGFLSERGIEVPHLIVDEDFGSMAILGTKYLQALLGFSKEDQDGQPGEGTRRAMLNQLGVDFVSIINVPGDGITALVQPPEEEGGEEYTLFWAPDIEPQRGEIAAIAALKRLRNC